jgi:hypothetical protein
MSEAVDALLAAMHQAAVDAAGAPTAPVSVQLDWIAPDAPDALAGQAEIAVQRVTRTLVFLQGVWIAAGARRLTAAGVYRLA